MDGFRERQKTLGELLAELRSRLGFMAQGSAAQSNGPMLTSMLQEAHDYLYDELNPPGEKKRTLLTLLPGSSLYDWHDDATDEDIQPEGVQAVWVKISEVQVLRMTQGITEANRSWPGTSWPQRYDTLNGQLEVWPVPTQQYTAIIEHIGIKPRFEQPTDRPGVPSRLLFQYALAIAKAHFRQPDAQAIAASFDRMLSKVKSRQHENRRYFAGVPYNASMQQVVKTSDGYRLKA